MEDGPERFINEAFDLINLMGQKAEELKQGWNKLMDAIYSFNNDLEEINNNIRQRIAEEKDEQHFVHYTPNNNSNNPN